MRFFILEDAMALKENYPSAVPKKLAKILAGIPKAVLAFSGGVDSSYLLYAAKKCGIDVSACYVKSQFQPQFELDDARKLADELGIQMVEISLDVLKDTTIASNPVDRCYHCKRLIFENIIKQFVLDGYNTLMDGSNASDDATNRPGMRALKELVVRSPLREAGITKEEVRRYSREAALFTWNKDAYACLATRVPYGETISSAVLRKIENAETMLIQMGFTDLRVRVFGSAAKLQLPAPQISQAAMQHAELVKALSPWFSDVMLDLKPR